MQTLCWGSKCLSPYQKSWKILSKFINLNRRRTVNSIKFFALRNRICTLKSRIAIAKFCKDEISLESPFIPEAVVSLSLFKTGLKLLEYLLSTNELKTSPFTVAWTQHWASWYSVPDTSHKCRMCRSVFRGKYYWTLLPDHWGFKEFISGNKSIYVALNLCDLSLGQ